MLHEFSVGDEVTPLNIKDGSETALVEALEESWMVMVVTHNSKLYRWAVRTTALYTLILVLFFRNFFVPHTFEQSAKGTVHLCQSAVNFLSMLVPGAMAHPGKSKVFLPVM